MKLPNEHGLKRASLYSLHEYSMCILRSSTTDNASMVRNIRDTLLEVSLLRRHSKTGTHRRKKNGGLNQDVSHACYCKHPFLQPTPHTNREQKIRSLSGWAAPPTRRGPPEACLDPPGPPALWGPPLGSSPQGASEDFGGQAPSVTWKGSKVSVGSFKLELVGEGVG